MSQEKFVTGIGGLFFRAKDPSALGHWYQEHFGINSMQSTEVWKQQPGPTVFAPFKADTDYFGDRTKEFMINFRVNNLDGLLQKLQNSGVRIDENRQEEAIGKFAWVYDPEGNKIELWEPTPEHEWKTP